MKHTSLIYAITCILLSSCTFNQFEATATGSALGGIFGSSIGGLIGGYKGHDIGTITGMMAGAAIGLAATSEKPQTSEENYSDVEYETYQSTPYRSNSKTYNELEALELGSLRFADENNNHYLEPGEHASLIMEVYNRSDYTLFNVAPHISCSNKHIQISPTAIVSELEPGKGFRYRAEVLGTSRLKDGEATFKVSFVNGKQKVNKKTFRIFTKK